MTTSILSNTFSKVCLVLLSLTLRDGENINIGGLELKTLKKLKGDKLGLFFSSMVLAKAIGLGPTAPNKYPCNLAVGNSEGVMETIFFIAGKGT
jgi:hypothetical protein|tara:strand:+ start:187 stop:468 length:282 start_codon:yes stop_codon:yes gene_type:complete